MNKKQLALIGKYANQLPNMSTLPKEELDPLILDCFRICSCLQCEVFDGDRVKSDGWQTTSDISRLLKWRYKIELTPKYIRDILTTLREKGCPIEGYRAKGYRALWGVDGRFS